MASDTNGGTAGAGQPSDPYNNRLDKFTLFPRLPGEARIMIWKFAMEEPRLVHLRVEGCGIKRARRRGCPRGGGPYLTIDGERYEQVPPFFFVSREARFYALTIYTIRFSVAEQYRDPENQVAPYHFDTNLIMSPNDILVSWHVPELVRNSFFSHFSKHETFASARAQRLFFGLQAPPHFQSGQQGIISIIIE